jgi:glutathione S-transferase
LVEWYLHEIGTPYTHREDRAGLPNPFGQIPALLDGDVEIFESGAILLYLADKYGLISPECHVDMFTPF